jgi:archaemetzincin
MAWWAFANEGQQQKIYLTPVGTLEKQVLDHLQKELPQRFGFSCAVTPEIPIPEKAYNPERRQYLSTALLRELKKKMPKDTKKRLGIVDKDLHVPELNFVFGEAELRGKAAVIALPRLRQEYYRLKPNQKLFLARTLKEAVHELGHTFGLRHCPNPKCVMHFSNSLRDTDVKNPEFCEKCQPKLESRKPDKSTPDSQPLQSTNLSL